jgi:tRNA(Arg) A34 adenosine deaminase TadA
MSSEPKKVQPPPEALHPPVMTGDEPLAQYWKQPLANVAHLDPWPLSPEEKEKHRIYSLALMSLVKQYWNGNKKGNLGLYPWRQRQIWIDQSGANNVDAPNIYKRSPEDPDPGRVDYLGHNIACLAVDGDDDIIDFDFNHNNILSSSVEHAESRLIRRIFSLTQLEQGWNLTTSADSPKAAGGTSKKAAPSIPAIATTLNNVTVYTSLESCAQCSGIMALAQVGEVVYLQKDFGAYCIGNIMYNLGQKPNGQPSGSSGPQPAKIILAPKAPKPIAARDFDFEYYDRLGDEFESFYNKVGDKEFWNDCNGKKDNAPAVTSFLCSDIAWEIFRDADLEFQSYVPKYGERNQKRLEHARDFAKRMVEIGRRGTPHKL